MWFSKNIKLVLLLIGLFGLNAQLLAQEESNRFIPSFFAGVITSQVQGDTYRGFNKLGWTAGVGMKTNFSESFGLGWDLAYIEKGSRKQIDPDNNDYSYYRMALQYVEVPVYVIYYQEPFDFEAGLSLAYLIGHKEETEAALIMEDDFFAFNDLDLGIFLGFTYAFSDKWGFQARYSNSIVPFRDFNGDPVGFIEAGQYHNVVSLKTTYTFGQ